MSQRTRIISSFLSTLAFLFSAGASASLAATADPCPDAVPVALGASRSIAGLDAFEDRTFSLFIPESGHLILDVAPLTPSAVEPKISFLGHSCHRSGVSSVDPPQYLTALLVNIDLPGFYFFRVAAQDPAVALEEYVLYTRFVENSSLSDKEIEEPEEDPDLLEAGGSTSVLAQKEVEEPEEDPDLVTDWRYETLPALCRSSVAGDEADVFSCAAPLDPGQVVVGAIEHGQAIDRDVFTFLLTDTRTFEIKGAAEHALFASLYDRQGHRLAMTDTAGGELRIAGTLGPGRYFLRVTGAEASEGLYGLVFDTLDW